MDAKIHSVIYSTQCIECIGLYTISRDKHSVLDMLCKRMASESPTMGMS